MRKCDGEKSAEAELMKSMTVRHVLPPRWWIWPQLFDTAVHGVDELTETLSPVAASGRPPNTTCPDTWPCGAKDVPSVHGSSGRAHRCAPTPTTNAVSVLCMTKKFRATNTWDEKHSKSTVNHPNQNSQAMALLHKQGMRHNK